LAAAFASPARADTPAPVVIPAVGRTVHYRVTRLAQGNAGPRSLSSDVTLRRKSATALTLKGIAGDPAAEQTVLTVQPGGLLQIPAADSAAAANGALVDVVNGLNRLVELFAGERSIPRDGWSPILHLPDLHGANSSVAVPVAAVNAGSTGFDLHGVGQFTVEAPAAQSPAVTPQRAINRRRGYRGGPAVSGAFPGAGGAFPGTGATLGTAGEGSPPAAGHPSVTVAVAVDGSVRRAAVRRISILETRSVTVDDAPYVNVSGWTIEGSK
jgi:hypothetical protein